jgi:hypothetical protein
MNSSKGAPGLVPTGIPKGVPRMWVTQLGTPKVFHRGVVTHGGFPMAGRQGEVTDVEIGSPEDFHPGRYPRLVARRYSPRGFYKEVPKWRFQGVSPSASTRGVAKGVTNGGSPRRVIMWGPQGGSSKEVPLRGSPRVGPQ